MTGWTLSSVGLAALGYGGVQLIQGLGQGNNAAYQARNADCYEDCSGSFLEQEASYVEARQKTQVGGVVGGVGALLLGSGLGLLVVF